jgi:hypothetical protein
VAAVLADWGVGCQSRVAPLLVWQQQCQGYQVLCRRHLVLSLLE